METGYLACGISGMEEALELLQDANNDYVEEVKEESNLNPTVYDPESEEYLELKEKEQIATKRMAYNAILARYTANQHRLRQSFELYTEHFGKIHTYTMKNDILEPILHEKQLKSEQKMKHQYSSEAMKKILKDNRDRK